MREFRSRWYPASFIELYFDNPLGESLEWIESETSRGSEVFGEVPSGELARAAIRRHLTTGSGANESNNIHTDHSFQTLEDGTLKSVFEKPPA